MRWPGRIGGTGERGPLSLGGAMRFGLVGACATLIYLLLSIGLGSDGTGIPPAAANVVAILTALAVSYVGHHRFTFGLRGGHDVHLGRFAATSAVLLALSTLLTVVLTDLAHVDHRMAAFAVAIGYPPASYLANALWSFRARG